MNMEYAKWIGANNRFQSCESNYFTVPISPINPQQIYFPPFGNVNCANFGPNEIPMQGQPRNTNPRPRVSPRRPPEFKRPTLQYLNPVFHERNQSEDDAVLSPQMIKIARKSGGLNLSGRGLAQVPEKVYDINQPDEENIIKLEKLTISEEDAWWNQVPLATLDLSSNALTHISSKIENLLSLTTLILQDNALVSIPAEIGKLEKLTRINLSHNKLSELPRELFTLPELRHLNISYNNFEELDPDISDLHMLEFLDASHNNIQSVPCGIGFLVRLTALLLPFNHVRELPPDLVNMRSLQKLDLMQNDLTDLPADIGSLRKLQCLYVQHNDISTLPDFEGSENLQELHISNNFLDKISKSFCSNLSHLKILDLRDNKISILPDEICLLRNLTRLDISNNSIANLPTTLASLPHLISLQVDGNPIKSIRRDILQCGTTRILKTLQERASQNKELDCDTQDPNLDGPSTSKMMGDGLNPPRLQGGQVDTLLFPDRYTLRHTRTLSVNMENLTDVPDQVFEIAKSEMVTSVDFSRNRFVSLPRGLSLLCELATEIVFANNQLNSIPTFISQFTRISIINFACNNLTELPQEFGLLQTLRELNISNNRFECLPTCIYDLQGLEILLACDNHIKNINASDCGLGAMKRLATLDLRNNDIEQVPPILGNLTNITTLQLIGNPFRQPRHQVLTKGTHTIMSYLRDRIPN